MLHVANAVTGDTFMTLEGSEIRLAGILAPGPETGAADEEAAILARGDLAARLEGRAVTVAAGTTDRYGRLIAQVFVDGRSLQEDLLRAESVLAAPDIASAGCAAAFLAAEAEASNNGAGHWGGGAFRVLTLAELMAGEEALAGSFQIVEARVQAVDEYRGRRFVNFGSDYRNDFTVNIAPEDMRSFREAGIDPALWQGKTLCVRGWLESYNGPNISVAVPGAVEVLE
jgi:micrococcal nuclease